MREYETIWEFSTKHFTVRCEVTPEDLDPRECFVIPEDIARVERGELAWFMVRMAIDGPSGREIATDFLGGCAYENPSDFIGDGYFRDMVRNICSEARAKLANAPRLREPKP